MKLPFVRKIAWGAVPASLTAGSATGLRLPSTLRVPSLTIAVRPSAASTPTALRRVPLPGSVKASAAMEMPSVSRSDAPTVCWNSSVDEETTSHEMAFSRCVTPPMSSANCGRALAATGMLKSSIIRITSPSSKVWPARGAGVRTLVTRGVTAAPVTLCDAWLPSAWLPRARIIGLPPFWRKEPVSAFAAMEMPSVSRSVVWTVYRYDRLL